MKKLLIISALFLLALLVFPKTAFADCEIASWDENTRNLQVCVGQFDSKSQLKNTTVEFNCLANSNTPTWPPSLSACRGITNPTFNLQSTPNNQIGQDADGKFFTCVTGQGLNRAIGQLEVNFTNTSTGAKLCTIPGFITAPKDWDSRTEGRPWQEGTNEPIAPGSITCPDEKSINTAIGCIPIEDTNAFIGFILRWAIGVGGGIAFLLITVAGFQIMTSAGNPEKLQAGRELLTSAIAGLILLVFSVFILRIIGVDILKLPGL